jgi:urease accessory protein
MKDDQKDVDLESWLPALLQTNDSIFPSGTYAHSFGLEGLVELNLVSDVGSLRDFLQHTMIPSLQHFELPMLHFAYEAALDGNVPHLLELDVRYAAMKTAQELRTASARIGGQRLQMLLQLTPHPLLERLDKERLAGRFQAHAPMVYGAQMAITETPLPAALLSYFYQTVAALVSAAMKLMRLGQNAGQKLLTECLSVSRQATRRALTVTEAEAGWFSPLLDIASARHETAYTRIFIS